MKGYFFVLFIFCWAFFVLPGFLIAEEAPDIEVYATTTALVVDICDASSTPELIINTIEHEPDKGYYNAGDKGKLFFSFEFFADSCEDLYLNNFKLAVINSISSFFFNPGIAGDNIANILVTDGISGEEIGSLLAIDVAGGIRIYSDFDLFIPKKAQRRVNVYADVVPGIEKEVSSKIVLVNPAGIKATGVETGNSAAVKGTGEGAWIKLGAKEPKPDLIVTGMHISQSETNNNIVVLKPTYINILYKNIGNGAAPEEFSKIFSFSPESIFEFGNEGKPISTSSGHELSADSLLGSEEYAEIYVGIFKEPGEIELRLDIDHENTVTEINDWNNKFIEKIIVHDELNFPDFIVYDIIVDPVNPEAKEDVRIDVIYKNIGSDYARDKFPTYTYFGQAEGWFFFDAFRPMIKSRSYPSTLEPLKTGETLTESYWGNFGRDREIELEAAINPFGQIEEANSSNNRFKKKIVIRKKNSGAVQIGGSLAIRLKGRIVLKVESVGEAYYINPGKLTIHSLGRPDDAFRVMREQGVGIKTSDLERIPVGFGGIIVNDADSDGLSDSLEDALGTDINKSDTDGDGLTDKEELARGSNPRDGSNIAITVDSGYASKHNGKIFLAVEKNGEAWYVNPVDGKRYFLGRPIDAFSVMRNLGLGISNSDFNRL